MAKVVFNFFSKIQLPLDKWTYIDAVCATSNLVAFNVIGGVKPNDIIDIPRK
jgi:hypothetical protein